MGPPRDKNGQVDCGHRAPDQMAVHLIYRCLLGFLRQPNLPAQLAGF